MAQKKETAVVYSQEELAPGIFSMWIVTDIADEARPGQFISVYSQDGSRLLPRPISICEADPDEGRLRIVYRIAGKGTDEFSKYVSGDPIDIMGPLGNGFPQEGENVFLIGGGIGVPPMLEMAKQLNCEKQIILGYRDENLFLRDEFEAYGEVFVATEDGSVGTKGNVLDAIREQNLTADVIYACGPTPMLRAIKEYAAEKGIKCYISLEEKMACGIGACLACVCQSKDVDHQQCTQQADLQGWSRIFSRGGRIMRQMAVNLAGVELKNPVMTASGTFGSGAEYGEMVDLNKLGAVVTKGVANVPWPGNPTPRIAEVYGGMINAIGLQNPGYDLFASRDIPFLRQYDTKIIVNVCGKTTEDYVDVVEKLASQPVDMLEINISCPNVKEGGIAFGQDPKAVEAITREVKRHAKQPIIMKLSPNVTDITEMAKAAEAGGADVLSLINTLTGMKIDINRRTFAVANRTGGLSGPAVKPVAVRMVYQVAQAVKLPIIGMGGIMNADDAIEFILAGASAVAVGTANFHNPYATEEIVKGIDAYMAKYGIEDIHELIGAVR